MLNKLFKIQPFINFGIYSFGTLLFGFINFALIPVYSKYLNPSEYGVLNIIILTINVMVLFVDFGLTTGFSIKYYKVDIQEKARYVYNVILANTVIFVILVILIYLIPNLFIKFFKIQIDSKTLIQICIVLGLTAFTNFFMNLLRLQEKALLFFLLSLLKSIVLLIFVVYFLKNTNLGLLSYIHAIIIALSIVFITAIIFIIKKYPLKYCRYDHKILYRLITISIPIFIGNIASFIIISNDKYILKLLTTATVVGIYSMSYRFGNLIDVFLTNPLGQAISPVAFRSFASDTEKYKSLMKKVFFSYILLGFFFILFMNAYLDIFYHFFIDARYWESFAYVNFITFGFFFWGGAILLSATVIVKEKTYITTILIALSGIINAVLNFLFIPKYGAFGAALSILIVYFILFLIYYKITQSFIYIKHYWKDIFINSILFFSVFFILHFMQGLNGFDMKIFALKTIIVVVYIVSVYFINKSKVIISLKNLTD